MKISVTTSFPILILLSTGAALAQSPAGSSRPNESTPRTTPTYSTGSTSDRVSQPSPAPATPAPGTPAAATPAPRTAAAAMSPDYKIVAGDKLNIQVYKDNQLSQALQVRPDGKITLPLIGDVRAEGRTATELRDSLVESLKEYNNNPVVTVIVTETVPPVFYVMGEVNAPGTLPLKGQITVVQALAMAGGFKDFAKKKDIMIQRKAATGSTTVRFNYNDAIKGNGQPVYVQPGDTIIVP
jgi:polysaccharide biosynthesis/export protein